jgi:DNA-directed RNA polymerase subunit RPC12/RpoP
MTGGNVTNNFSKLNEIKCSECSGEIKLGIAIHPDKEYGARYLINPPLINHKTIELISVYKCKSCGYSEGSKQ